MRTQARLAVWIALLALLALTLTGCYKSIGEPLEPTPNVRVGPDAFLTPGDGVELQPPTEELITPLPTEIQPPTLTPFPTLAPPTATPLPTQDNLLLAPPTFTHTPGLIAVTVTPAPPQPLFPTFTPQPTFTPLPTYTPPPTQGPLPTFTPLPTYTPLPTNTPLPTYTPPPTYTPFPTNTRAATFTPLPPAPGPTLTFTPVPFATFPPSPTFTPFMGMGPLAGIVPTGAELMQPVAAQMQPVLPQPTEAVPLAENPAAFGVGGPQPTEAPMVAQVPSATPTPTATPTQVIAMQPTINPGLLTATMMVFNATATSAAATGVPLPTFTPDPLLMGAGQQPVQPVQPIVPGQFPPNATVITATPFGQGGICAQHLVLLGETLYSIARRYGVTAQEIQAINPAKIPTVDDIRAGDTIDIPCPRPVTATPPPVPVVTGVPGQEGVIVVTPATQRVHIVQKGETLFSIARTYGVDILDLMRANGFTTTTMNYIVEGQQIIIPGQVVTPAPTAIPGVQPTLTPFIIIVTAVGQ